jgi:hypothetical protein
MSDFHFSVGDIVKWRKWNSNKNIWDINYGIITTINDEIRFNRIVSICKVAPFNNLSSEMEFFAFGLKLVSSSKKGTQNETNS